MEIKNNEELSGIMTKFADSGWDLIAEPAKAWLEEKGDSKELLTAIEQADKECGNCGCEYDQLYKDAIRILKEIS